MRGWPLFRVATKRGTTVSALYGFLFIALAMGVVLFLLIFVSNVNSLPLIPETRPCFTNRLQKKKPT